MVQKVNYANSTGEVGQDCENILPFKLLSDPNLGFRTLWGNRQQSSRFGFPQGITALVWNSGRNRVRALPCKYFYAISRAKTGSNCSFMGDLRRQIGFIGFS